jgi:hypothetical protein
MPESTTPPLGRIEVGRIGAIPIYFNAAEKKFEATIERPARPGGYRAERQVITRKDMAAVEREILKNTSARIEVIHMPAKKGRTRYGYRSSEQAPREDEYGPLQPLRDLPDTVEVITAEGGKRDSYSAVFRTEKGDFIHGPFARPNAEVTAKLKTLLEGFAEQVAAFEREWDRTIGEYEQVSAEQITAEIRASISAAKSTTAEPEA